MTEKEKFYEEVDKRVKELIKLPAQEKRFTQDSVSTKYWETFPNAKAPFRTGGATFGYVAKMEIALKMGKPVDEITGEKENPKYRY